MSGSPKAVFLSYASQDAAVVTRIADALRAAGVEVWFDQNELVGGDAWDAKIRGQIGACALFVPVVSANTQARREGYFRVEWKLAAQRTLAMADGTPFLLPVVLDATRDGEALVPAEFKGVQWTRLPGGEPTPAFVARVQRLLGAGESASVAGRGLPTPPSQAVAAPIPSNAAGSGSSAVASAGSGAPALAPATAGGPARQVGPRRPAWLVPATAVALALIAVGGYFAFRPDPVAGVADPGPASARPATDQRPSTPPPAPVVAPAPTVDAKSIAVLPFENRSAEQENEFFADGVHEDLLTALAKVRDLKVIARTSVLGYRDPTKRNLRQIAQELGVAHILEGSVRRAGGKARISVQLSDARTGAQLWAESYDRDVTDIFAVQGEVAREITAALRATLTPDEQRLIGRRLTNDPAAYDLYLRARSVQQELGERGSLPDYERAIGLFEQVVARDPGFVLAHVQLAQLHSIHYWFGTMDPTPARAAKMKAAVDTAERLAPDLPEVRMVRGAYLYRVNLDWNAALAEFRAAEAGLPNDAQLKFWLAVTHRRLGRWQEALGYFEQSVAVNPRDLSAVENWIGFLVTLRRHQAALAALARVQADNPAAVGVSENGATPRLALTGDREAYARTLAALPPAATEESRVSNALRVALARGDLAGAEALLAATRATEVTEESNRVILDPVAFHRAFVAAARGDQAAARRFAAEAERYYRTRPWTPRQQPWARMRLALSLALAGRGDEAVQEAREGWAAARQQDVFASVLLRDQLGATLLLAGRRDEALAVLREVMETPLGDPGALYRFDPLWAGVAGAPEFEAILRLEKSL